MAGDGEQRGRVPGSLWPSRSALLLLAALAVAAALPLLPDAPDLPRPAPAAGTSAACPGAVSEEAPIDRVGGGDRFATAACASEAAYPGGADHVVLARGDSEGGLADALAGAVLARAVDAPVLLVAPDVLPEATSVEIERLRPDRVTVLGGPGAVTAAVVDQVRAVADDADVARIAGPDRSATAARVAEAADTGRTAFVVNGHRPADSLVAAAPAARAGAKLLLADAGSLPEATRAALTDVDTAVIVGGHGVVSADVEATLRDLTGAEVRRVAGADRGETAASVARAFPADGRVHLAAGDDAHLVDAVTAGWSAAMDDGGPLLYVADEQPGRATDRWLRLGGLADEPPARLVGGTAALPEPLVDALEQRYAEAADGGPAAEVRGVWVHLFDETLKTRRAIHRMLDDVAAAGGNTVIVQVARRQDAYYRSDVLPRTTDPEIADDLDLIEVVTDAAHDRGLAVHAWASVLPAHHPDYDSIGLPHGHVWREHGRGTSDPWVTRRRDGREGTYLDPGVPAVQEHVAATMAEIAGRYPVDAVHIDYLRYDGAQWGYHPTSLARYRDTTGAAGTPATDDPGWSAWRRQQTHELARRIADEVAAADPSVAVSMAGSTMGAGPASSGGFEGTRTYRDVFQDWPQWLAEGTVDAVFPMNYFREADGRQGRWYDEWTTWASQLAHDGVLAAGQGSWFNTADASLSQIARAHARLDGAVIYSYQETASAGDPQQLLRRLRADAWSQPAPAPGLSAGG